MFSGTFVYTVDPKGRVTMPQKFRQLLGNPFVLTKGLGGCLLALSSEQWDKVMERFKASVAFQRFYLSSAHEARAHSRTGRFLVPAPLRHSANVRPGSDVAVVGIGDGVEIWDKGRWDRVCNELPAGLSRAESTFELSVANQSAPGPFEVRTRTLRGLPIVACGGTPDADAAAQVSRVLEETANSHGEIILDMRQVSRLETILVGMRFAWPEDRWAHLIIVAPESSYAFCNQYLGFARNVFPSLEAALWNLEDPATQH